MSPQQPTFQAGVQVVAEVNGIVVDVRMMPPEFQEEAHRLGLIPFVPV